MINEAWVTKITKRAWKDLIKVLESNNIDASICSHLLREFLIYNLDNEDDMEFFFGEPKSSEEIDKMIDSITQFQRDYGFLWDGNIK